jgi:zinc protease
MTRWHVWRPCLVLAGLMALAGGPVLAGAPPAPERVTSLEGITEYRLANGLKVLLFPDASKPTVTVNITYFVGSRHEGYGETGMAHLLEHMVFKGTPRHREVWKALQDHGAQFNGTTSYDRTNYFETLSASEENLEFALDLEADRMVNSFIARKDLDSEFSVVRNEFEMGENSPVGVLMERIMSTAYLWHNYGKSTIGSREDIERVPIDRLQAFYRKYYQPDNAMLVVAGKFDEARTLDRINALFGVIPRPARVLDTTYTVEPPQDGEREVTLRRVGDVQAIGCVYHICAGTHEDMPALTVLADVLDATQTGRLYKALVETELATSVSASADALFDPGVMMFMARVRLEKPMDEVRKVMLAVLDGLAGEEFTEEEVARARNRFASDFTQLINNSGRVGLALTESAATGDWRLLFYQRDQLAKVTPADVRRVAGYYLRPTNRTVGVFVPTKAPSRTSVPPAPDIVAMLKDYKGSAEVSAGEAFEATPEAIEARTQRGNLPVGAKLALLPRKTRGGRVNVAMTLHYGSEATLKGRIEAAGMMAPMLSRGTSRHTRRQLQDRMDELKTRIMIGGMGGGRGGRIGRGAMAGGGPGSLDVMVETVRENLPEALRLAGEMLRESSFPEKEFKKLKKQALSGLEQQLSEPMALAMVELRRRLSPFPRDHVRYVPTVEEQIERTREVSLAAVKGVHAELLGAADADIAVIGDFDAAEIRKLLAEVFEGWRSRSPFERVPSPYQSAQPDTVVIETPDKANSLFSLGMNLQIRDDDPDYPALSMANFLLGANANSRLLNRIRQKEGLSYGCGSSMMASPHERSGSFVSFGICAPQNAEKAVACAREEIDKMLREGITQKELDEARKGYFEQVKVQLSNDGPLAGMLARDLFLGRTMKFRADELEKIRNLTVDDVNRVFRKHVKPDGLVEVRAGDFKKTADTKGRKPAEEESADKTSS